MMLARKQSGAILVITLIMIALIAVIGVSTIHTGTDQINMARNAEARNEAMQRTQSIIDAVLSNNNLAVNNTAGLAACFNVPNCPSVLSLPDDLTANGEGNRITVRVNRLLPLYTDPPPNLSSSAGLFTAAQFEVEATYDATDIRGGSATLVQGVMVLINRGSQ